MISLDLSKLFPSLVGNLNGLPLLVDPKKLADASQQLPTEEPQNAQ